MEPTEVLRAAYKAVTDAGLPENLQVIGFTEAVRLISGPPSAGSSTAPQYGLGTPAARRPTGASTSSGRQRQPAPADAASGQTVEFKDAVDKVSSETGVDADLLESVFHIEGGTTPQVTTKLSALGSTVSERQKNMALLLSVFRYHALGETETSMAVVRDEAKRLRINDSNINKRVEAVPSLSYVGPSEARRVKVRPSADGAFADLVRKLTGEPADS